ncbi:hypothetical protein JXB12_03755 [candidate division KSB1 bacterium]|nr:hypothetical protein [candidate division KSB1 bacterium]
MKVDNFQRRLNSMFDELVRSGGRIMLIGATDSGKTTLTKQLLNVLTAKGGPVGFLDADIGQSTIGLPGTIGAAVYHTFDMEMGMERQATDVAYSFIGSFSPVLIQLEMISGTMKMLRFLDQRDCKAIVIDTTGLVHGKVGIRLKRYKIECIRPDHMIFLIDDRDVSVLGDLYSACSDTKVHTIGKNPHVSQRSMETRRQYRMERFRNHFRLADELVIPLPRFIEWRTDIITRSGNDVRLSEFIESKLDKPVLFSSIVNRILVSVIDTWTYHDLHSLTGQLPVDSFYFVSSQQLHNRMVAIENSNFEFLTCGILKVFNFSEGSLRIKGLDAMKADSHILKIGKEVIDFC